jgi:hypothetical protein
MASDDPALTVVFIVLGSRWDWIPSCASPQGAGGQSISGEMKEAYGKLTLQDCQMRNKLSKDGAKPKRTMSADARRRIGAAQRKRWAAAKGATGMPAKKAGKKAKRHMSAEGRAAIAEATRKRWEAFRAAKAAAKK